MERIVLTATRRSPGLFPLSGTRADALLRVFNKTLLEYNLEELMRSPGGIVVLLDPRDRAAVASLGLRAAARCRFVYVTEDDPYRTAPGDRLLDGSVLLRGGCCFEVRYPWDLLRWQEEHSGDAAGEVLGTLEPGATLKGSVRVGRGTLIRSGAYIEGPVVIGDDCTIGPNCYIRGVTSIGHRCRVGNAVEIKNSIVGNDTCICHLSYLGDSVTGDGVNLGAGFLHGNLRHDGAPMTTPAGGVKVATGRTKLGVFIGDGVHTGVNTTLYPGRKIAAGVSTLPGAVVNRDIF